MKRKRQNLLTREQWDKFRIGKENDKRRKLSDVDKAERRQRLINSINNK